MNKWFLLVFLITSLGFVSEEEKIVWQEGRKLTWADFKGTPNRGNDFVASTNSGVLFSFSYGERNGVPDLSYSISANFYPDLSWYKVDRVSPYILAHEQAHFDITELHARKLRKALSQLPHNREFKDKASTIYNDMEAARREMQKQYDADSDHSNIKEAEYQWRAFIQQELEALSAWK
tara:strand:- start:238 stop:771 length:534 start_codon:yes stop_codon:yes gene_type:complete